MEIHGYVLVIITMGLAFFGSVIAVLCWAVRQGHFKNFEQTARSIFSNEEPIGMQTDGFPSSTQLNKKGTILNNGNQ